MGNLPKSPAPWLFSLLILPLGIVVVGFNGRNPRRQPPRGCGSRFPSEQH